MRLLIFLFALLIISWKSIESLPIDKSDIKLNDTHKLSSKLQDEDQWQTSLYWMCYPSSQLKIEIAQINYDGVDKEIPEIHFNLHNLKFVFSIYPDYDSFDSSTLKEWERILTENEMVCLYAVHLPNSSTEKEQIYLFYVEKVKTDKSLWEVKEFDQD